MSEKITVKLPPESPEERARLLALIQGKAAQEAGAEAKAAGPLPISFFVGLILLIFGLVIAVGGLLSTALAERGPSLGWGAALCVGGGGLIGVGLRARRSQ